MITITFEEYGNLTEEDYCELLDYISQWFGSDVKISESEE